jgi:hypothetical protein
LLDWQTGDIAAYVVLMEDPDHSLNYRSVLLSEDAVVGMQDATSLAMSY